MLLFETTRMQVRGFSENDGDLFFAVNGNAQVMRFIRPVKSRSESDAFLEENIKLYSNGAILGRYAVFHKPDGRFIGTFSFLYLDGKVDYHIGYAFLPENWGRGLATELVTAGVDYFFSHTDAKQIFGITETANIASQQVLQKTGFELVGQVLEGAKTLDLYCRRR
jgi:[ribosomal protein S5]-alanine N-acetyltransferase